MTKERRANLSPDRVPNTREYRSAAAFDYAELGLIEFELGVCKEMIEYAERLDKTDLTNSAVSTVLWRDTILVLAEMFGPKGLDPDATFAGDQDAHKLLSDMKKVRRSYSAHRHGAGRWSMTGIHLYGADETTEVLGVSYFTRLLPLGGSDAKASLDEFIDIILTYIKPRLEELNAQVLEEARRTAATELWALPPAKHAEIVIDTLELTRKQIKAGDTRAEARRRRK